MIDFYGNIKERINSLVSDGYVTYFEALDYVGNGKNIQNKNFSYDRMISKMSDDNKKHCYSGALVDYSDKKILYMCDSNDINHTNVLFENNGKFIQIDNYIDNDAVLGNSRGLKKIISSVIIDGKMSHYIVSYYDLRGKIIYESCTISKLIEGCDLISNHESNKIEIAYKNVDVSFVKFNNSFINDSEEVVRYVNKSFEPIYSIFDDISYNKTYVKK